MVPIYTNPSLPVLQSLCDYKNCGDVLEKQAQQFRAIQKRLLTRFKDKTPTSLSHLDTLLDGTYLQVCVCVCVRASVRVYVWCGVHTW